MGDAHWVDAINQNEEIYIPIRISYDCEYESRLKTVFDIICNTLEKNDAPKAVLSAAKDISHKIVRALDAYYKGGIVGSYQIVFNILKELEHSFAISKIRTSISFPREVEGREELQLFRARLSETSIAFKAKEMRHIPFNQRSKVKSERFSIPGLPCLYLGNTSYACWLEMGCPPEHQFNVSPVTVDPDLKIFNLTCSTQKLYTIIDWEEDPRTKEEKIVDGIKVYLLNVASSFHVKEQDRHFKSEYIIPQMIMLACKALGLNGIAYHSKKVEHEAFAAFAAVNLALFADYNNEKEYSAICNEIKIGDSYNYALFKQLLPVAVAQESDYKLRNDLYYQNLVGDFKIHFRYQETTFYEFDKFLFSTWKNRF